jgi:hypothetical protein
MPRSIDIAHYEKAPTDDEWPPTAGSSSASDDIEDTAPMLGKKRTRPWPAGKINWLRSPWFYLLDLLMIALIMIFFARKPTTYHLQWQGDITGFVPTFSQQVVTFRSYPEFVSNHTSLDSLAEARSAWVKLLPRKFSRDDGYSDPKWR